MKNLTKRTITLLDRLKKDELETITFKDVGRDHTQQLFEAFVNHIDKWKINFLFMKPLQKYFFTFIAGSLAGLKRVEQHLREKQ